MILTIDIGNSNIVTVLYDENGNNIKNDRRLTLREASYDKYEDIFSDIKKVMGEDNIEKVMLSSVVPYISDVVMNVLEDVFNNSKILKLSIKMVPDLKICLKQPRELGADIIATAAGALFKYGKSAIIADLGSATKLSIINENKEFLGGIIMPGIEFQAKSLNQMIPHLPLIEINKPATVVGNSTTECIQSGIIYGTLSSIIELSNKIEKEVNFKCKRIITGGLAKLFSKEDLENFVYDEFLLSDGLYHIAKRN